MSYEFSPTDNFYFECKNFKGNFWVKLANDVGSFVLASAGINLIHGGTHAIFGLLKIQIEESFEDACSQELALWVLSAASTFMLLAGTV